MLFLKRRGPAVTLDSEGPMADDGPMNNTDFESYVTEGCGRCEHFRTPACKVHPWADVLRALRGPMLEAGLVEEMKWGMPCYTLDGQNVAMVSAFKARCVISFFKGFALSDPSGALTTAGPNSRVARLLEFRSLDEVAAQRDVIRGFVAQAMALARSGVELKPEPAQEPMPEELEQALAADPALAQAFDGLTPGRQRSFVLYVGGAKQAATRVKRAARCAPKIMAGKGYNER